MTLPTPAAWTEALDRAAELLPEEPPADVLATVALAVYVLPAGASAGDVRELLDDGRVDLEGEPAGLKDRLYAGLVEKGQLVPGDPVREVLSALTYREPWAIEAPLAMTDGLSRDNSRLYEAVTRARTLLA